MELNKIYKGDTLKSMIGKEYQVIYCDVRDIYTRLKKRLYQVVGTIVEHTGINVWIDTKDGLHIIYLASILEMRPIGESKKGFQFREVENPPTQKETKASKPPILNKRDMRLWKKLNG